MSQKIFVATENLVFGFELFIGERAQTTRADNSWVTKGQCNRGLKRTQDQNSSSGPARFTGRDF